MINTIQSELDSLLQNMEDIQLPDFDQELAQLNDIAFDISTNELYWQNNQETLNKLKTVINESLVIIEKVPYNKRTKNLLCQLNSNITQLKIGLDSLIL